MEAQKFIRHALVGDVIEAYDELDALLASIERHAPRHASRIEQARDLVFQVRVEMETEADEA